jgi:hypothetical protein
MHGAKMAFTTNDAPLGTTRNNSHEDDIVTSCATNSSLSSSKIKGMSDVINENKSKDGNRERHKPAIVFTRSDNLLATTVPSANVPNDLLKIATGDNFCRDEKVSSNTSGYTIHDVLCGRGKVSIFHEGNKFFRKTVEHFLDPYIYATDQLERSQVVQSVIDTVHRAGGNFKKKLGNHSQYYALSNQQCRDKVGSELAILCHTPK